MLLADRVKEGIQDKIMSWYQHTSRRCYIQISPQDIRPVARFLFRDLKMRFSIASGTDTPEGIEILYHFSFDKTGEIYSLRVLIPDKQKPQIDSLASEFPAAEWIEREIWDMLGINFIGHPNLKRLLLAEDWPEGEYPLRQSSQG